MKFLVVANCTRSALGYDECVNVLIFANPIAGKGRGKRIANSVAGELLKRGHKIALILEKPDTLESLTEPAPQAAIVIGGDGTLRSVAQFLIRRFPTEDFPPLLVVPLGTANLMGRHLEINWRMRAFERHLADALEQRRVAMLDGAIANGALFLLMAGVGIDGAVVHGLSRVRKGPIDFTSYALPAALALQSYAYPSMRVCVDDREVFAMAPGMAFVGNVAEYGTGFPILPHARSDDGLLDVCVLPCRSREQAIQLVLRAAAGEHLQVRGVVYTKGTRVKVESPQEIPVQLDGDAAGHTPLDIRLLPDRLPFIVP
jgi:diacylglycerol kinase (ATP)